MSMVLSSVAALLVGILSPTDPVQGPAQSPKADVRAMVQQAAFDPTTYFPSRYIRDSSIVRIAYTGDDYGWPVYSIAIAEGCKLLERLVPARTAQRVVLQNSQRELIAGDDDARMFEQRGERHRLAGVARKFAKQCDQAAGFGFT